MPKFLGPKSNSFLFKHKYLCFLFLPKQHNYTQVHTRKISLFQMKFPRCGQVLPMDLSLHLPGQSFSSDLSCAQGSCGITMAFKSRCLAAPNPILIQEVWVRLFMLPNHHLHCELSSNKGETALVVYADSAERRTISCRLLIQGQ